MATSTEVPVVTQFLAALADRDYDAIASCFTETAKLRALVPSALREDEGPEAIAARFRLWFEDLEQFELLGSNVDRFADRVRLRYRCRGEDAEDGAVVVEQEGYAAVEGNGIGVLNLVCSGWRPAV
jgi:SnoaL-like domain